MDIGTRGAKATGYLHTVSGEMKEREVRPCVVVCPGGGYGFISDRENEPVALALVSAGYQVFVLRYSTGEKAKGLAPLMEVSELVSKIRTYSGYFHVEKSKIAVMGFSAGGHLAASLGTLWRHEKVVRRLPDDAHANWPNALILCYPVITAGEYTHEASLAAVSGGDKDLRELLSLEKQVSGDTPPAFVWHTAEDASVPVENSLLFVQALRKAGVPFEAHLFGRGGHGLSMCTAEVGAEGAPAAPWFGLCLRWLGDLFQFRT